MIDFYEVLDLLLTLIRGAFIGATAGVLVAAAMWFWR